jgi:prepilin-type N-terminal cleavage/methylation domain-containing protein
MPDMLSNSTTIQVNKRLLCVHRGFTLIELSIVVAIIATVAGIALFGFSYQNERQDAVLANSVQAALQTAIGQMVVRLERTPTEVFNTTAFRQRLMRFAQGSMGQSAQLNDAGSGGIRLTFGRSTRWVDYGLNAQGDIIVTGENFVRFNATTGLLEEI